MSSLYLWYILVSCWITKCQLATYIGIEVLIFGHSICIFLQKSFGYFVDTSLIFRAFDSLNALLVLLTTVNKSLTSQWSSCSTGIFTKVMIWLEFLGCSGGTGGVLQDLFWHFELTKTTFKLQCIIKVFCIKIRKCWLKEKIE